MIHPSDLHLLGPTPRPFCGEKMLTCKSQQFCKKLQGAILKPNVKVETKCSKLNCLWSQVLKTCCTGKEGLAHNSFVKLLSWSVSSSNLSFEDSRKIMIHPSDLHLSGLRPFDEEKSWHANVNGFCKNDNKWPSLKLYTLTLFHKSRLTWNQFAHFSILQKLDTQCVETNHNFCFLT